MALRGESRKAMKVSKLK